MEIKVKDCTSGFFRLIDEYCLSRSSRSRLAIHRICTILRQMDVQSVIIEELGAPCSEWVRFSEEMASINRRLGCSIHHTAFKFTFVAKKLSAVEDVCLLTPEAFLGYAIVNNIVGGKGTWTYVFECVLGDLSIRVNSLRTIMKQPNYYLHVKKAFHCTVGASFEYTLLGTFFRQQNSITSVCAHACAAMMLNNSKDIDGIISAESINAILNYDQVRRKLRITIPEFEDAAELPVGLTIIQLEKVFEHYGFKWEKLDFNTDDKLKLFRPFLYSYVESAYPALLAFGTHTSTERTIGHVVPVIGHTLNPQSWLPMAFSYGVMRQEPSTHLSSLSWVNDLIIHDDIFGPQLCLPAHAFRPETHPDTDSNFIPSEVMGIFPHHLNIRKKGHEAERAGIGVLQALFDLPELREVFQSNYYLQRLCAANSNKLRRNIVARTLLLQASNYIDHLRGIDGDGNSLSNSSIEFFREQLEGSSFLWLVEITEPDLYVGNRAKVIDVLVDPSAAVNVDGKVPLDKAGVICIRFPGFALAPLPSASNWQECSLEIAGHYPLFTHV